MKTVTIIAAVKKKRKDHTPVSIRLISKAIRLLPSKQLQEGDTEEDGASGKYNTPQDQVAPGIDRQFTVEIEKDKAEQAENDSVHTGDHVDDGAGLVIA